MIPTILNLGSGKNYIEGVLNIDINPMFKPDLVDDISNTKIEEWILYDLDPKQDLVKSKSAVGHYEKIIAHDVLEHIRDLVPTMTNCLNLLKEGGEMDIIVPYDLSRGAWSDPTHVRAFNERSWIYFNEWSWYIGWTDYAFQLVKCELVVAEGVNPDTPIEILTSTPRAVEAMKVLLKKVKVKQPDIQYGKA